MRVGIRVDGLEQARQAVAGFSERRMRAVLATAATRTARDIERAWQGQLQRNFDRPTPATAGAAVVAQATAQSLEAAVAVKDRVGKGTPPVAWLGPEERGGQRGLKKFEQALISQGSMAAGWRAVPGPAAPLDGYGNVRRSTIVQVIAQLGAEYSPGYQRVISSAADRRARKALATGRKYIAIREQSGAVRPGIYLRDGRRLRPVFFFVRAAGYRPRLSLLSQAEAIARARFPAQLERALGEAVSAVAARTKRS